MIRSINRKRPATFKIQSKKAIQLKSNKPSPSDEMEQLNAERYYLEVCEKNIQSLQDQRTCLQEGIFELKKDNSAKENQIQAKKQYLRDLEEKIKKRQIALLPHLEKYHKTRFSNEQVKQKNKILINKVDKIKSSLTNSYKELEKINTENSFNFNDTYEVYQIETYNVESLQSRVQILKNNSTDSRQKIIKLEQTMKDCEHEEKEIQKSIEDAYEKLSKLQEKRTILKVQEDTSKDDLKSESLIVEILESKIRNLENILQSPEKEEIENELNKARSDYEHFANEIFEKKKNIFKRQKNLYMQKEKLSTVGLSIGQTIDKINKELNSSSEDEVFDNEEILLTINEQLSMRSKNYEILNNKLQAKQIEYDKIRSKIEESWIHKTKKIDDLKDEYLLIQKEQTEILFQTDKINDLKEKVYFISSKLRKVLNEKKVTKCTAQDQEIKLQKLHEKIIDIDQKEKYLLQQEEKLEKKNKTLVKRSDIVMHQEKQIQIKEEAVFKLENEVQLLKNKLTTQMKEMENTLLVTPFHEKIGLTA